MFLTWMHKIAKLINKVIPGFLGYKKHEGQMEKVQSVNGTWLNSDCTRIN